MRTKYGHSIALTLYNTARNVDAIREIVKSDAFAGTGLIVGPVYEEGLHPVILYAEEHDVPVVSPLASITGMNSDALFQMAPDPSHKWDKVADLVNGDKQVTLIYSDSTDKDFESEILALLGDSDYRKYTYTYVHPSNRSSNNPGDLTPLLDNGQDNVFVVMTDDEVEVERILAAIASADTSITGPRAHGSALRRAGQHPLEPLRQPRPHGILQRPRGVHLHLPRQARLAGDPRFRPCLYPRLRRLAFALLLPRLRRRADLLPRDVQRHRIRPGRAQLYAAQTTYLFGQGEQRDNHVNRNWTRVNYNSDFTITIE